MATNRAGRHLQAGEQSAAAQGGADEPGCVQEAPPAPTTPRYHIRLKSSPDAIVAAAHPGEAQSKYMNRMSLRSTVHPFQITEWTDGQEAPPEVPEKPIYVAPVNEPIAID